MPGTFVNAQELLEGWPQSFYVGSRICIETATGHKAEYLLCRTGDGKLHFVNTGTGSPLLQNGMSPSRDNYCELETAKFVRRYTDSLAYADNLIVYVHPVKLLNAGDYIQAVVNQCKKVDLPPIDIITDHAPDYLLRKDGQKDK